MLIVKLEHERPPEETTEAFNKIKHAYDNLVAKHEEYVQHIEDDGAFEAEERWLDESQDAYLMARNHGHLSPGYIPSGYSRNVLNTSQYPFSIH